MATAQTIVIAIPRYGTGLSMSRLRRNLLPWPLELHPAKGVQLRLHIELDSAFLRNGMAAEQNTKAQRPLLLAFAPLHRSALGIASGVVLGGLLAAATLTLVVQGGYPEPNLGLLAQFLRGYSISWRGIFIGFLWGWAIGFVLGWGFALVRNAIVWIWLAVIRSRAEMDQYSDFLDHL